MGKRQERDTKRKIINSAWRLFQENGYENTTVEDILDEAGISRGTFYHYFEGKDALFSHLSFVFDEAYIEISNRIPEDMNAFDKLLFINFEICKFIENEISVGMLTRMYSTQLTTAGPKQVLDRNRIYYRLVRTIVEEGQKKGQIRRDITVNEIVKDYSIIERGTLYDWCVCDGEYGLTSYCKRKMPLFFNAFKAEYEDSGNEF